MTAAKPEQDLEGLRQRVEAMLMIYGNNVLTTQPIQGPGYIEPPIHVAMRANNYTDHFMRLVQAEVAAAQELFWLRGYEAGFAVGSGNVKGEPWAVVEQRLLKNRPELAKLVNPPQQPPTEGGSDGDKQ